MNTLLELLLLVGGVAIWENGELIRVSRGDSENDHKIAVKDGNNLGFKTNK